MQIKSRQQIVDELFAEVKLAIAKADKPADKAKTLLSGVADHLTRVAGDPGAVRLFAARLAKEQGGLADAIAAQKAASNPAAAPKLQAPPAAKA